MRPFSYRSSLPVESLPIPPPVTITSINRPRWVRMESDPNTKDPITVIMGATGTGKSQLSMDLSLHFPSEIINADKIQLYKGLDITTNKIPLPHRRQVPHHLLGQLDPTHGPISALDFLSIASSKISDIISRQNLPLVVGGSNSFIHALVTDRYEPTQENDGFGFGLGPARFRYECCFLWVDVSVQVLFEYLCRRVDDMLEMGMFEELAEFSGSESCRNGLRSAIGVPEFDRYFRRYGRSARPEGDSDRSACFEEAVEAIKENTCRLAERQIEKIQRLRSSGWDLHRFDATDAFRAALESDSAGYREDWAHNVVEPSVRVVERFLEGGRG
ncbi:hypothetical protein MRB53_031403 [Persea americana]|uniref:Uncharacterized protein n=1 Tax=Persea americana TaxID=3435 RepID=A0ACC2KPF5_PERAE|nr:hypothetical protein MRB53_031403 [Persea americana]